MARMTQTWRSAQTQARDPWAPGALRDPRHGPGVDPWYGSWTWAVARAASEKRISRTWGCALPDLERILRVRPGGGMVHWCVHWPGHRYGSLVRVDGPGHRYGA
jgi:hypothetical protein